MIRLEFERRAKNMSKRQLGRACSPEVDPTYISRAERQGMRLYPGQAERIAAALGFEGDPAELFEEVTIC